MGPLVKGPSCHIIDIILELTAVALKIFGGDVGKPPGNVATMELEVENTSYQSPGVKRMATLN